LLFTGEETKVQQCDQAKRKCLGELNTARSEFARLDSLFIACRDEKDELGVRLAPALSKYSRDLQAVQRERDNFQEEFVLSQKENLQCRSYLNNAQGGKYRV
jgi:hypothetical protein